MAKFYGAIGFAETVETTPGVWEHQIVERNHRGELTRNNRRLQTTSQVNDNLNISNQISILADPYADQNFHSIIYAKFMGAKWKVTDIEVQPPRLILTLGGVYNDGD